MFRGRRHDLYLFVLVFILLAACTATQVVTTPPPSPSATEVPTPTSPWTREGWDLVWQDEFGGEAIDRANWTYDIGGNGWGNNEWQYYTDRPENARIEDGVLVIEAKKESLSGRDYTSARLKTQGLQQWTYGRVEARLKLPYGQGIWPAFWMLGEDISSVGWPASGEIDIMENIGDPFTVYGTVHGPGYSGADGVGGSLNLDTSLSESFHVFSIEWDPEEIRWFVDDVEFLTVTPVDLPGVWVYDHDFFVLLNLAVGGNWPGYPDASTRFPQKLLVDYVRVYRSTTLDESAVSSRGEVTVADITLEVTENEEGWQGLTFVTVVDQDGQPVASAKVKAGWLGVEGDDEGQTDAAGVAGPFRSRITTRTGEVSFCITDVEIQGYTYMKSKNNITCVFVER